MRIKKVVVIAMAATMMLCTMLTMAGCSNGRTIEVDGWTLFEYNGSYNTERGRVNIISANRESLVVDGVLTMPAKIGKYNIYGFGGPGPGMYWSHPGAFEINADLKVEHIVFAAELHVDFGFSWGTFGENLKYVEFLSDTFDKISSFGGGIYTYIIPDDSTQNFIDRLESRYGSSEYYNFIEKTKFLEDKENA